MHTELPIALVMFYFAVAGFFIGWAFPRGKYLKAFQMRLLRAIHNFFADEEEYIAHKVNRIKKATRRKK